MQLLFGFDPLDPVLLTWTISAEAATRRFQSDLPAESRRRILQRAAASSNQARKDAETSYVTSLWDSTLAALRLPERAESDPHDRQPERELQLESTHVAPKVALPAQRTVGDWLDVLAGASIVEQINGQMTKWTAAFVDQGIAGWPMPGRDGGYYRNWRELAQRDLSGRLLGIKDFAAKVRDLPDSPEETIAASLNRLGVPEERWVEYLSRQLAQLSGWAGFIRWLGDNPDYPGQHGHAIDPIQYLAVRLFYEVELAEALCRQKWGIAGTLAAIQYYWREHLDEYRKLAGGDAHRADRRTRAICRDAWRVFRLAQFLELAPTEVQGLSDSSVATLLAWLDAFPEEQHGPVWLEAYEANYREQLIARLSVHRGQQVEIESRPRAQLVCCIDVRSEPFRRHIEAQGPYETFGFAGFFGMFIHYQAFDSGERNPLCPVLFKPKYAVNETPRPAQDEPLRIYASGTRWHRLGSHMFHDLKQNPVASFMLIDFLGFVFSAGLIGKTLMRRPHEALRRWMRRWFDHPVATQVGVDRDEEATTHRSGGRTGDHDAPGLPWGLTIVEQANSVEFGLRMMGLTRNFGRFVVLCGHGSATDNNPYFSALDCGACGGKHGDPNARAFAAMANKPEVRRLLKELGLAIPDDTWFLAGKHNTTSDRVAFYDVGEMPPPHHEDLNILIHDLEEAGALNALERCGRLPRAPKGPSPESAYRHMADRTVDWANVRPEWGLSASAAFIIGRRRTLTRGVDLAGRVFLHSYDPEADSDGKRLEFLMTAPMIVVKWLNAEYYFSAVDPWFWGSGSKVIHNVVAGVGVMLGAQSDLQTGLALQSVNDGPKHFHEPMRLLVMIEAPVTRITPIIQKHTVLQHLFHNHWLTLVAVDPASGEFQQYNPDGTWKVAPATCDSAHQPEAQEKNGMPANATANREGAAQ